MKNEGNRYYVQDREAADHFAGKLRVINPTAFEIITRTVEAFGDLSEVELVRHCYDFPEFTSAEMDDLLWDSSLPDRVPVVLDADEAEDLELALNPQFVESLVVIAGGLDTARLELQSHLRA